MNSWKDLLFSLGVSSMSLLALPEVNGCGLGLPDVGLVDIGEIDQCAIFRTERDVVVGFRHHGRLACDRIANDAEAVLRSDHEVEEAVEIVDRTAQRVAEVE